MIMATVCGKCGSCAIEYLGNGMCYCHDCGTEVESRDVLIRTPFERTRDVVYATGNKWAIENFNATHY